MLDRQIRAVTAPLLSGVAKKSALLNITPMTLTITGWLFGVTSCILLEFRLWLAALGFWLMNRLLDRLDGALARSSVVSDLGGFVDIVADFSIYGGFLMPLAFAVPGARVAVVVIGFVLYKTFVPFAAAPFNKVDLSGPDSVFMGIVLYLIRPIRLALSNSELLGVTDTRLKEI